MIRDQYRRDDSLKDCWESDWKTSKRFACSSFRINIPINSILTIARPVFLSSDLFWDWEYHDSWCTSLSKNFDSNCHKFPRTSSKTSFVENSQHPTEPIKQRGMRFLSLPGGDTSHPIESFNGSSFFKECAIQTEVNDFETTLLIYTIFRTRSVLRQNHITRKSLPLNGANQSRNESQTAHRDRHRHTTANGHRRTVAIKINANGESATVIDLWFTRDKPYTKRFIICEQV